MSFPFIDPIEPDSLIHLAAKIVITYAALGDVYYSKAGRNQAEPSASSALSERTVRRAALTAASDSALESVLAPSRPPSFLLLPPPLHSLFAAAGRSRESAFLFFFSFRSASLTFTDWAAIEKAAHLDFVTSAGVVGIFEFSFFFWIFANERRSITTREWLKVILTKNSYQTFPCISFYFLPRIGGGGKVGRFPKGS